MLQYGTANVLSFTSERMGQSSGRNLVCTELFVGWGTDRILTTHQELVVITGDVWLEGGNGQGNILGQH